METKKTQDNAERTQKEQKSLEAFAHTLTTNGVTPAITDRILGMILNTETDDFFTQLPEAAAALQAQAERDNEPGRWADFITDLGNIAGIIYNETLESETLEALRKLMQKAASIDLEEWRKQWADMER